MSRPRKDFDVRSKAPRTPPSQGKSGRPSKLRTPETKEASAHGPRAKADYSRARGVCALCRLKRKPTPECGHPAFYDFGDESSSVVATGAEVSELSTRVDDSALGAPTSQARPAEPRAASEPARPSRTTAEPTSRKSPAFVGNGKCAASAEDSRAIVDSAQPRAAVPGSRSSSRGKGSRA